MTAFSSARWARAESLHGSRKPIGRATHDKLGNLGKSSAPCPEGRFELDMIQHCMIRATLPLGMMTRLRRIRPRWPDLFAIGASAACLVHCLLPPLLFVALPIAARALALPEDFHLAAFTLAIPASAFAMRRGYRHHGLALPALIGVVGLLLLGAGAVGGFQRLLETGLTVMGSVLLAIAHLTNWRLQDAAIKVLAPVRLAFQNEPFGRHDSRR